MAWPAIVSTAYVTQQGSQSTYALKWGTDALNPFGSNYIVVSCSPNDKTDVIYIENGIGLETIRVLLAQGRRVNITVIDDSAIVPPHPGTSVSMIDILGGSTGSAPPSLTFTDVENSY